MHNTQVVYTEWGPAGTESWAGGSGKRFSETYWCILLYCCYMKDYTNEREKLDAKNTMENKTKYTSMLQKIASPTPLPMTRSQQDPMWYILPVRP